MRQLWIVRWVTFVSVSLGRFIADFPSQAGAVSDSTVVLVEELTLVWFMARPISLLMLLSVSELSLII